MSNKNRDILEIFEDLWEETREELQEIKIRCKKLARKQILYNK